MPENAIRRITAYHRRTKHAADRYALGPGYLDWDSQPDPFRRFDGARRVALPLSPERPTPAFAALAETPPAPLDAGSLGLFLELALGLFLELALGLSAWKEAGGASWALRNNPSSGNLHPTEGWVVLPALDCIGEAPALYHYAPYHHALEERCRLERLPAPLPEGTFLLALSAIPWREAWKYGERALRYCQHDAGHALAAASYAGACLGWRVRALAGPGDDRLAHLLGLDRADAHHPEEPEHPDLICVVSPLALAEPVLEPVEGHWFGAANRLGDIHESWPVIGEALACAHRPDAAPIVAPPLRFGSLLGSGEPAGDIIRRRRSAQRMDNKTGLGRDAFFRMLAATLPDAEAVPWRAFPWAPRIGALALFVHRVEGLSPGLYALIRDPQAADRLPAACESGFAWDAVESCPLPLFRLRDGDIRWAAAHLSCQQSIAGNGAFSLGMLADFARTLAEEGAWAYRRLFWEAGMIGQVLYLEATAAGVAGTGIGCYHDDEVHALLGLAAGSEEWQSLYHFTVGGAVEDSRIATRPAYHHLAP
ncbi:nitroreductase [Paramagnetospirillum marisnigri]|uniref:Nitroreductase n=1 Tax=Paramagnetospirillum marisnigri TaxID=1285242 RepID=A0A178MS15_9PROT|nr:SagB/ThcOx family dehydrogenase [Paramagnetospirillum marisnigri]OAN52401.1 nitroreductase [Paramagnetospirillum marisnigri]